MVDEVVQKVVGGGVGGSNRGDDVGGAVDKTTRTNNSQVNHE